MLTFKRHAKVVDDRIDATPDSLVIAGWTGRNPADIAHHIAELAAIGVPPPSTTPLFYRVSASLLTTNAAIQVVGAETSGEVETVIVALNDGLWLGLGSDHTDRKSESFSIALSKQLCQKPMAADLWPLDEVIEHWDQLILRSWAVENGVRSRYQEGSVAGNRHPRDLMSQVSGGGVLAPGTAMFCGTMPVIGGIRPASRFEMELEDPVLGRKLNHAYDVRPLPVIA
jgi:hypothetical protein